MKPSNEFRLREFEERERELATRLFKQAGITEYHFSEEGSHCHYDGYFIDSEGITNYFEVKVRTVSRLHYPTEMILKNKVGWLQDFWFSGDPVWYFFFHPEADGEYSAVLFSLTNWFRMIKASGIDINDLFYPLVLTATAEYDSDPKTEWVTKVVADPEAGFDRIIDKLN
jgi:hypothetical protein